MNHISNAVLSADQVRDWDRFTMEEEFISSLDLMENAAAACLEWLISNGYGQRSFTVYCGKGNNGGDGLALARLLAGEGCKVTVFILESEGKGSPDYQSNLALLKNTLVRLSFIQDAANLDPIDSSDLIIDALFGSGLNRPLEGIAAATVRHINNSSNEIISIDLPSGMRTDTSSLDDEMIRAMHTLTFQSYKLAFLIKDNAPFTGDLHILYIGLSPSYLKTINVAYEITTAGSISNIHKRRKNYSHKGTYGHAALVAGSQSMMGAAVLSATACLRSGTGKLTCYIPEDKFSILHIAIPEAITASSTINTSEIPDNYDVIGVGPGIGISDENAALLKAVFKKGKPVVIDADALNILAEKGEALLNEIPEYSILTPHPKEFERLFGASAHDFERIAMALKKAKELKVIIILKGYHSLIALPDGKAFFNNTGNPGMATAGSGDVLTGIITGLMAQKYTPQESAVMGVYLHGLAGDIAASRLSQEAMIASDITRFLGEAFLTL